MHVIKILTTKIFFFYILSPQWIHIQYTNTHNRQKQKK